MDPEQLEQLLESLVKARVGNKYHQMRQAAQQKIEMIRQQARSNQQALHDHVQVRLQQLQQEKQTVEIGEQEGNEKARQCSNTCNKRQRAALQDFQKTIGDYK